MKEQIKWKENCNKQIGFWFLICWFWPLHWQMKRVGEKLTMMGPRKEKENKNVALKKTRRCVKKITTKMKSIAYIKATTRVMRWSKTKKIKLDGKKRHHQGLLLSQPCSSSLLYLLHFFTRQQWSIFSYHPQR